MLKKRSPTKLLILTEERFGFQKQTKIKESISKKAIGKKILGI
ncbi:hypothetical protein COO91_03084 [Nostoc flagelliforme CCNUN1]|uniref:Uncharacterized protein n=1 Tax=Nostoc flagelliforme CCNUN1 TaxID=2038116 RepID=A0A2K8SP18_9NOSO|nr:hypothetical protein COO91_03084 [Nostoc flagelliforme CCNUN1]